MTRKSALAAAAALALALCGCAEDPYAENQRANPIEEPAATAATEAGNVPRQAQLAATQYARAARTWTPDTLRAQHVRQLQLSTGQLHRALEQIGSPSAADVQAARADRASATATLGEVTVSKATVDRVVLDVDVAERSTSSAEISETDALYRVSVVRRPQGWLVDAFTAMP